MALGTEFAHNFCAGISPLQLGIVLIFLFLKDFSKCLFLVLFWCLKILHILKISLPYISGWSKVCLFVVCYLILITIIMCLFVFSSTTTNHEILALGHYFPMHS